MDKIYYSDIIYLVSFLITITAQILVSASYSKYKKILNNKDKLFELSKKNFNKITSNSLFSAYYIINYDIDDVLRNKVVYSEGNNGRPLIYGECNRSSNKIEINKTGTIIDSILLTHELGHYKNEREGLKNESKLFLSEILPMSEEFIMCDNLSGHEDEKVFWYKHSINSLYE